jgi:peptide/nickel transport system substrate-binding protein
MAQTLMKASLWSLGILLVHLIGAPIVRVQAGESIEQIEFLVSSTDVGSSGGTLHLTLRNEPKTLNPAISTDLPSRSVITLMMADLLRINRESHETELHLASSLEVSPDGKRYTVRLRRGVRFSDGHPLDADDVLFTFRVLLDETVHSSWRDLLIIGGKPIEVRKIDSRTIVFEMSQSYGAGDRIFDHVFILPQHILEDHYQKGELSSSWSLNTAPEDIVGLGPFRLVEVVPGERLVLERNPHYWKSDRQGNRLPYLDRVVFSFVPRGEAQVIRFKVGESHVIEGVNPRDFSLLESQNHRMLDLGPGLDYNFVFFNLNQLNDKDHPSIVRKQKWFRQVDFRRAVSAAIDRKAMVSLVYQNRASQLASHVTPGNKLWVNESVRPDTHSPSRARELLGEVGFTWRDDGTLMDPRDGEAVEFSILTTAGNEQRTMMATIIQEDLQKLGMKVQIVTLDFGLVLDRVLQSFDYEACLLALRSGDVDPTAETSVWLTSGSTHLWHLGQTQPATEWEAEIDEIMKKQMISVDPFARKKLYDRLQQIVAEQLPIIPLVSPNVLVGADGRLGNFHPGIQDPLSLWNAGELYLEKGPGKR